MGVIRWAGGGTGWSGSLVGSLVLAAVVNEGVGFGP